MLARDTRDAPNMQPAADAVVLDTTTLDAEAVFERAVSEVRRRLPSAEARSYGRTVIGNCWENSRQA